MMAEARRLTDPELQEKVERDAPIHNLVLEQIRTGNLTRDQYKAFYNAINPPEPPLSEQEALDRFAEYLRGCGIHVRMTGTVSPGGMRYMKRLAAVIDLMDSHAFDVVHSTQSLSLTQADVDYLNRKYG
ncbi:MAG: hypothetical protein OXI72_00020 [Gemmatimonadota bacterium]|nr:hypothetical protein [Gemmatimonadota bacterium]